MANENKITQIIINQEPYTIGNDSDNTQYLPLSGGTMTGNINMNQKYFQNAKYVSLHKLPYKSNFATVNEMVFQYYPYGSDEKDCLCIGVRKYSGASGHSDVLLDGLLDPTADSQAANKHYVDTSIQSSSFVPIVHTVENLLDSPSYQGEFEFTVPKDCMFWVQVLVTITTRPSLPGTGGSGETENNLDYLTISIVSGTKYHYEYKWSGKFAGVLEFYPNYSNNTFGETEDVTFTISTDSSSTGVSSIGEVKLSYIKFPTYTKDE